MSSKSKSLILYVLNILFNVFNNCWKQLFTSVDVDILSQRLLIISNYKNILLMEISSTHFIPDKSDMLYSIMYSNIFNNPKSKLKIKISSTEQSHDITRQILSYSSSLILSDTSSGLHPTCSVCSVFVRLLWPLTSDCL